MNTCYEDFKFRLLNLYTESEIMELYFMIMQSVCGLNRQAVLLGKDNEISPENQLAVYKAVSELQAFRPIQYVLGETEFYGMKFYVDEKVLIPRPETEELVELALKKLASKKPHSPKASLKVWDIGTGSGCIAISLAKAMPQLAVYATDINHGAINIARRNASLNSVEVKFVEHDIFGTFHSRLPRLFDFIISNPPYVTEQEAADMHPTVKCYEPREALFAPAGNPLAFYRRIALLGLTSLRPHGTLMFEINPVFVDQIVMIVQMLEYYDIEVVEDISGKDRFICCKAK